MADEPKKKDDAQESDAKEAKAPAKKGGIIKYILFGVIGLVLVGGIAFGTLMFLGGGEQAAVSEADGNSEGAAQVDSATETSHDGEEGVAADEFSEEELDPDLLEMIENNLNALDYTPDSSELESEHLGMSKEDSIKEVNWIEQKKKELAKKEKELAAREKELQRLDAQVSQKLLKLEQAESARVSNLAKLYDSMDPRSVAKLMANLDDKTVVSILPRMKIKNASAVLQLLPPKRAARLSKQMITIAEK